MSNKPNIFKDKKKKITKAEANEIVRKVQQTGKQSIDFGDRILEMTMLVDIKSSTIKIGNATQKMRDIPVSFTVGTNIDDDQRYLDYLESFDNEEIRKVILDNGDGFKVMSLKEVIDNTRRYMINGPPQVQAQPTQPQFDPRDPRARFQKRPAPSAQAPAPEILIKTTTYEYSKEQADACVGTLSVEKPFKSCARWPEGTILGSENRISTDAHTTREQAQAVCNTLMKEGFGGEGKIFPIGVWVDPPETLI